MVWFLENILQLLHLICVDQIHYLYAVVKFKIFPSKETVIILLRNWIYLRVKLFFLSISLNCHWKLSLYQFLFTLRSSNYFIFVAFLFPSSLLFILYSLSESKRMNKSLYHASNWGFELLLLNVLVFLFLFWLRQDKAIMVICWHFVDFLSPQRSF